jgi:hypothetical protein
VHPPLVAGDELIERGLVVLVPDAGDQVHIRWI